MDRTDRRLLDLLQSHLPLTGRPYQGLATALGLSEEETLQRLRQLKGQGILRQIGAIFDSSRLGYHSTLVALETNPSSVDLAACRLNAHPGISHNYARDHRYNIWFTLTLPRQEDLREESARLAGQVGARDFLYLPALAVFKVGVRLNLSGGEEEASDGSVGIGPEPLREPWTLTCTEIQAVRALQTDLPLESRPFKTLAQNMEIEEAELLALARKFLSEGIMRRFAGTLFHRQAGYLFNLLVIWRVSKGEVREAGGRMAAFAAVSHCYQRLSYPHWPYSLYAMFHARSKGEAEEILKSLVETTGLQDYLVLTSLKEYKKQRVQYFQEKPNGA